MLPPMVLRFSPLSTAPVGFGVEASVEPRQQDNRRASRSVGDDTAREFVEAAEACPAALRGAIYGSHGLLLARGLGGIVSEPGLLVRLTAVLGDVESYRDEGRNNPAYLSEEWHHVTTNSEPVTGSSRHKRHRLVVFIRPQNWST